MTDPRDTVLRALRRMLANGLLTALPKRPADQEILLVLAASRFDAGDNYLESDVNERLKAWLATISEPFGIDHVTLRRCLVDARFLVRTKAGSTYRVNAERVGEIDATRDIDPVRVLSEVRSERELRKRERAA
jgi:hypothetical protein